MIFFFRNKDDILIYPLLLPTWNIINVALLRLLSAASTMEPKKREFKNKIRACVFHYQINYQNLFDNCHLNFRDIETRQN
jgi:hypothetical protein